MFQYYSHLSYLEWGELKYDFFFIILFLFWLNIIIKIESKIHLIVHFSKLYIPLYIFTRFVKFKGGEKSEHSELIG